MIAVADFALSFYDAETASRIFPVLSDNSFSSIYLPDTGSNLSHTMENHKENNYKNIWSRKICT